VDIHHAAGTILRYLDGREEHIARDGSRTHARWREPHAAAPPYYRIPYRSLVPREAANLLVAGRLIDADREAFGAVRVMVNCNQMGEAVGVAAALALRGSHQVAHVPAAALRAALVAGGSLLDPEPAFRDAP
jgi:FAD dependent oxidoreductase